METTTTFTSISLDISNERCPMTFVKTKLLLETMQPGEEAVIRLAPGEALDNLPKSLQTLGHQVIGVTPGQTSTYLLHFRKA